MIGKTLNHFKVLNRLGKGGMAKVFVAEDGKSKRRVAHKVLPEEVARDPDRLDRFQREAHHSSKAPHFFVWLQVWLACAVKSYNKKEVIGSSRQFAHVTSKYIPEKKLNRQN